MKFSVKNEIHSNDVEKIERALRAVDADAQINVDVAARAISVESWLMPEEFIIAFVEEDYDVTIAEA